MQGTFSSPVIPTGSTTAGRVGSWQGGEASRPRAHSTGDRCRRFRGSRSQEDWPDHPRSAGMVPLGIRLAEFQRGTAGRSSVCTCSCGLSRCARRNSRRPGRPRPQGVARLPVLRLIFCRHHGPWRSRHGPKSRIFSRLSRSCETSFRSSRIHPGSHQARSTPAPQQARRSSPASPAPHTTDSFVSLHAHSPPTTGSVSPHVTHQRRPLAQVGVYSLIFGPACVVGAEE